MIRTRELAFGGVAIGLALVYLVAAGRVAPVLAPGASPTPTPTKPVSFVPIPTGPKVNGTIVFTLRGDIYVLAGGGYSPLTSEGRSHQPTLSADGTTVLFARIESIDGKRVVDGQVVPAQLRFSNVVRKDAKGGAEAVVLNGLTKQPTGFHDVVWFDSPALSPDGKRVAVVTDSGAGASDLALFDASSGKEAARLSQGSNLADPSWSPDGKTLAVTSYTLGSARILLVPADGRAPTPLKVPGDAEAYRPSYSRDGAWITYTLRHDGRNDLHAVEIAGGKDVALTSDGHSWNGVFSPDGKELSFLREDGGVIDLYFMEVADALKGGAPKAAVKLTHGEGIDGASRPAWGP